MGYLHQGHLSLMDISITRSDFTVVSIFVNPMQFSPTEDLETYPVDIETDLNLLREKGVAAVFIPSVSEIYGESFQTQVSVTRISLPLCGASRGVSHFTGVSTVVLKLFNIINPDIAVFGKKDFQQLAVIKRMVKDLDLEVEIISGETVREKNGLAMSSRNSYLNANERKQAPVIQEALKEGKFFRLNTSTDSVSVEKHIINQIRSNAPDSRIDYIKCLDADTLEDTSPETDNILLAAAVFLGKTRLIDNIVFSVKSVEKS